jgi:uncharacterized protein
MPGYLAPGVHIQEITTGTHTITGVDTSITAFVGRTASGPTDTPTLIRSFGEFEGTYGGFSLDIPLSYAVAQFFDNGGTHAVIARIVNHDASGAADESAPITDADIADSSLEPQHRGLWLLDQADLVNILCIPPLSRATDVAPSTWNTAIRYAKSRRAFVIVDPPATWITPAHARQGLDDVVNRDANAAIYFPRITAPDPLTGSASEAFAPSGAIAGLYARTDMTHGVWKSPAGTDATLSGISGLTANLTENDVGLLNPDGINCLRSFPARGNVVWGARTLQGANSLASEWKYVPVRRLGLFIEESLSRGTQWAASEPNAEPLWAELRRSVDAFMHHLFRDGAFQGSTPSEAYFVKCDSTTTNQDDINRGNVNVIVGFAPVKPAEFVMIRIQQRAGQAQA